MWRFSIALISIHLMISCGLPTADLESTFTFSETTDSLEIFGEGTISTNLYERDMSFSPDGKEFIYTIGDHKQTKRCLVTCKKNTSGWTMPTVLNISGKYQDIEPFITPDGSKLFFASNRPIYGDTSRHDYNIWFSARQMDRWSNPLPLDSTINTSKDEFYPSLSATGSLYFTSIREDGMGSEDIFMAEPLGDSFSKPVVLDSSINTKTYEFNAYVSPNDSLLIFSSYGRKDGYGGGDLYYSKKDDTGKWSPAQNLGKEINSSKLEYSPYVDWNNKMLYFTSERSVITDDPKVTLKSIRDFSASAGNGFGDIYRIPVSKTIIRK